MNNLRLKKTRNTRKPRNTRKLKKGGWQGLHTRNKSKRKKKKHYTKYNYRN